MGNTAIQLRKLKAKIVGLHTKRQRGVLLDVNKADIIPAEHITIHQYMRARKRRMARMIPHVIDE
jgi:predicted GTPase